MRTANGLLLGFAGIVALTLAFRGSLKNVYKALITPGGSGSTPPARQTGPIQIGNGPPPAAQPTGYNEPQAGAPGSGVPTQ